MAMISDAAAALSSCCQWSTKAGRESSARIAPRWVRPWDNGHAVLQKVMAHAFKCGCANCKECLQSPAYESW